jgi:hypothetical protein
LILLFSNIYFLLILFFDNGAIPFEGIHPIWHWLGGLEGRRLYLKDVFISFIDCFHYSCVTITTLGYGDMHATKWYSKLVTDFQVLLGLGIVIVSIGRYFSLYSKDRNKN